MIKLVLGILSARDSDSDDGRNLETIRPKYFAAAELEELRCNLKWLAKASDAIVNYWQKRNARKSSSSDESRMSGVEMASTEV